MQTEQSALEHNEEKSSQISETTEKPEYAGSNILSADELVKMPALQPLARDSLKEKILEHLNSNYASYHAALLIVFDSAMVFLATIIAFFLFQNRSVMALQVSSFFRLAAMQVALWVFFAQLCHLYDSEYTRSQSSLTEVPGIFNASAAATLFVLIAGFTTTFLADFEMLIAVSFFAMIPLITLGRSAARLFEGEARKRGIWNRPTLVVGNSNGQKILKKIEVYPKFGLQPVGFAHVSDNLIRLRCGTSSPETVVDFEDMSDFITRKNVKHLILSFPMEDHERTAKFISFCKATGIDLSIVPPFAEELTASCCLKEIGGIHTLVFDNRQPSVLRSFAKRLMDLLISSLLLIVLSPLLLFVGMAVRLETKGRILIKQPRVGKNCNIFGMYKFRSMQEDAERMKKDLQKLNEATGPIFKIRNDPRVTKVGKLIRKLSIDELPQLLNVMKGEMSLVGPRPLPVAEAQDCKGLAERRYLVKPGITGIWQVQGRSDLPFDEMVQLDSYYVDNQSLWLDLMLLLRTIPAVLSRKGAY